MAYPKFLYHETHAPDGRAIMTEADEPKGDGWHDTPAKFDPNYVPPPPPLVAEGTVPEAARLAGFVPQAYPSLRYSVHGGEAKRVDSADEDAALDPAVWKHSPDPTSWTTEEPEAPAGADAAVSVTMTTGGVGSATTAPSSDDEQKAELYKANVSQIIEKVSAIHDPALLERVAAFETDNPKGPRKTVLQAVKAQLALIANDTVTVA